MLEAQLLDWARLADLLRIPGIGAAYGQLLWRAGINSIADLAHYDPDELHHQRNALNPKEHIVRGLPPEDEPQIWCETARHIQPAVRGWSP